MVTRWPGGQLCSNGVEDEIGATALDEVRARVASELDGNIPTHAAITCCRVLEALPARRSRVARSSA